MKRILVAGAAGFLGVAVCEVLADKYEVRGIDLNPMPHLQDVIEADLSEFEAVATALQGVDGVINCMMARLDAYEKPDLPMRYNVVGLANLLEAARLEDVQRFVHASTTGIFSVEQPDFIKADSKAIAKGWYPITKLMQERFCENFAAAYGVEIAVMRIAGGIVCGRTWSEKDGTPLTKENYGSHLICRYDVANACVMALEASDIGFDIFHIGSTPECRAKNDVKHLSDRLGWKPEYDFEENRP